MMGSSLPPPAAETTADNAGDDAGMRTSRLQLRQMSAMPPEKKMSHPLGGTVPVIPVAPPPPAPRPNLSIATPPPPPPPPPPPAPPLTPVRTAPAKPATPVIPAAPAAPGEETWPGRHSRSRLGGLTFKKVVVDVPESLATLPPPKRELSQAAMMELIRRIAVVLLVLSSLTMLVFLPVFVEWQKSGQLEFLHALTSIGIVGVMGLLVIPKKAVLSSLGTLFIVALAGLAGVLTINPALVADLFPEKMLPDQALAAGGWAMMLSALIMKLASGTGTSVASGMMFVLGLVLPWLPVGDYIAKDLGITFTETKKTPVTTAETAGVPATTATLPPPKLAKADISTISTPEYAVELPPEWSNLPPPPATKSGYLYRIGLTKDPEAFSVLVATEHAESEDIIVLAARRLDMLRATNHGSQGYVMLISGCPDRRRIYLSSSQEVQEVLVVLKRKTLFVLSCQVPRGQWQEHKADLDTIFRTFTPR